MTRQQIISELRAQAGQENCDGDPYDIMMLAAQEIENMDILLYKAENEIEGLKDCL